MASTQGRPRMRESGSSARYSRRHSSHQHACKCLCALASDWNKGTGIESHRYIWWNGWCIWKKPVSCCVSGFHGGRPVIIFNRVKMGLCSVRSNRPRTEKPERNVKCHLNLRRSGPLNGGTVAQMPGFGSDWAWDAHRLQRTPVLNYCCRIRFFSSNLVFICQAGNRCTQPSLGPLQLRVVSFL